MKKDENQISVDLARSYVSWLIRSWRANLSFKSVNEGTVCPSDKFLARKVQVTAATFSRLSSGAVTCSLPVLTRIYSAISLTLGEKELFNIQQYAHSAALKEVLGESDTVYYGLS